MPSSLSSSLPSSFLITTQWQATQIFPLQAWSPYPYHWSHSSDQAWPPTLAPTQPISSLMLLPSFFLFANRSMFVLNYNCHATESLTDTGHDLSQEISRNSTPFLCCWTDSLKCLWIWDLKNPFVIVFTEQDASWFWVMRSPHSNS